MRCFNLALKTALVLLSATSSTAEPLRDACRLANLEKIDPVFRIPFRIVEGRVYVDARVNDQGPFVFAVDTGAAGLGRADMSLVERLALPDAGTRPTSDGVTTASAKTVRLDRLELGGMVREQLDVVARDYNRGAPPPTEIAGIIGRDFFADGLLIIDYRARRLTFTRKHGLSPTATGALAYKRAFRVPMHIGDLVTEGHIDTGANVSFLMPKSLFTQLPGGTTGGARRGTLTNTTIDTIDVRLPAPIRVGTATLPDRNGRAAARFPELVIGGKALLGSVFLIDQRSKAVAICAR